MAKVEIEMPQMGESVMEGTVIEWTKNVGDQVEEDETLLEIATDKVDTEVPSPQAGTLVEILAEEDDTIEVGQVIAIIETDADAAEAEESTEESKPGDNTEDASKSESQLDSQEADQTDRDNEENEHPDQTDDQDDEESSGGGQRVEVQMPRMGESVMEGTVIGWNKKVGDTVEEDETLLEISTDKVDSEVPSPEAGTLVEILMEEDETIEVGQTIAIIETGASADDKSKPAESKQDKNQEKAAETEPAESNTPPQEKTTSNGKKTQRIGDDGRFYSPLVRSIAEEENISQKELESIDGSGRDGRVAKQDIMAYLENRGSGQKEKAAGKKSSASAPSSSQAKSTAGKRSISAGELNIERPDDSVEIIKMDRMRKMIAEHMIHSKQTSAHVTTFAEVDVTKLVKWREANKQKFRERSGHKLTFTPLFIEHIIQAMREFPLINSSIDLEKGEIYIKKDINFGLAVALGEGGQGGLIVPVIKKAQEKNLAGLASEVSELAKKARAKDLSPDDLVGGTITLTNYGSVGNLMGTPVINQPQVAIIGTGAIEKRPVVIETEQGDVIGIRHMMYLSMSYDHRIIDGAHGGAFLNRVKELLEDFNPDRDKY